MSKFGLIKDKIARLTICDRSSATDTQRIDQAEPISDDSTEMGPALDNSQGGRLKAQAAFKVGARKFAEPAGATTVATPKPAVTPSQSTLRKRKLPVSYLAAIS
jgi:hypothetical protein